MLVALLAFAAVSWPQNTVAREPHEQHAATVAATAAVPAESDQRIVVLVVGTEVQALVLHNLQDGGSLLSGPGTVVLPLEIRTVDAASAANIDEQDEHLRSVCALAKCTKMLYVDLRTLQR